MKVSVRIISLILIFAMAFSLACVPVSAAGVVAPVAGYITKEVVFEQIAAYLVGLGVSFFGDELFGFSDEAEGEFGVCPQHPSGEHNWERAGFGGVASGEALIAYRCSYCGVIGTYTSDMFENNYRDWVSSLDSTTVSSSSFAYYNDVYLPNIDSLCSLHPDCFVCIVDVPSKNFYCLQFSSNSGVALPENSNPPGISYPDGTQLYQYICYYSSLDKWHFSYSGVFSAFIDYYFSLVWIGYDVFDSSGVLSRPADSVVYDSVSDELFSFESSRFSYLTHIVNEYNTTNNYMDNSTAVNFYLTDESSDDDTTVNLYSINLYDEETMVFTEPVSGQQYQSTGWTYDYNDRSYDITLESGTFTLNDTDITEVIVAYMDDYAAITYLDASGNAVHTVKYAYVAVSQSECALNGHVNTVETLSEPTCIKPGERKYTCSVCGNEEIETIPELGHIWKYSVLREPENGNVGLGIYECQTCGTNYTEEISAGTGDNFVDLDPDEETDKDKDYYIKFEDAEGNEQETSIFSILDKFSVFKDIYDIGDTLFSAVSADAAAAYALNDGGELGSQEDGAPSIVVNLGAAESKYGYEYGGQVEVLDLSWYAPYKERVDNIVSGFLWLLFLWGLFKTAPGILSGIGITENRLSDISDGSKRRF